jgi:hypothetical protein
MKLRTGIIVSLFAFLLLGCSSTTKPLVWKAKGVVISNFKGFEIQPVFNATGIDIDEEIMSFLTASLKERFNSENLQLTDPLQKADEVLIVKGEILVYKVKMYVSPPPPVRNTLWVSTGPPLKKMNSLCVLRTRLLQKSSNHVVAEIVTVTEVAVGRGLLTPKDPTHILKESAAAVAQTVANMF